MSKPGHSPQLKFMPKLGTMQQKVSPSPGLSPQMKYSTSRAPGGSVQEKDWAPGGAVQEKVTFGPGESVHRKIAGPGGAVQMKETGDAVQQKVAPAAQMRKGPAGALQMKVDDLMSVQGVREEVRASFEPLGGRGENPCPSQER